MWLEALGVALAPAVIALVLRLRLMAPITMADPSMHTVYIVDPQQMYARYAAVMQAGCARAPESAFWCWPGWLTWPSGP